MEFQSPEEELVVLCAQTPLMDSAKARIQTLLEKSVVWADCHQFAQAHEITPLFFHTLFTHWKRTPPSTFIDSLRQWYQQHSIRNLMVTAELLKFQNFCKELDLPMLVIDGPVLAKQAYGDVRLRQYDRLDVIVQADDMSRMVDLLLENNYVRIAVTEPETFDDYAAFAHRSHLFNFGLHSRVWPRKFDGGVTLDGAWDRLTPVWFTEREAVSTLGGGELLVYLCAQGAIRGWSKLADVCDVNQLLRSRATFDWGAVVQQIERAHDASGLLLGLALARSLFGTALPDGIAALIVKDSQIIARAAEVRAGLRSRVPESGATR